MIEKKGETSKALKVLKGVHMRGIMHTSLKVKRD